VPIKFMVRSLCGNKTVSGYRTAVYHEPKETGTRLRPPLHSFITFSIGRLMSTRELSRLRMPRARERPLRPTRPAAEAALFHSLDL
jgi:hypothetical protein